MKTFYRGRRRLLPAAALLLASTLEICGCNPVPDCDRVRNLQITSLDSPLLLERCAECLSARELAKLGQRADHFTLAGMSTRSRFGETVRQALASEMAGSFYDPNAAAENVEDASVATESAPPRPFPSPTAAGDSDMRFTPWPIAESVFFLYKSIETARGVRHRVPSATAFVLSVPGGDGHTLARFLVTARHVVDPLWAHCSDRNPSSIEVRLNRRSGGVGFETIPLEAGEVRRYVTPVDGTSDLAIIPFDERLIPDLDAYKIVDIPFSLLPTESDLLNMASAQQDPSRGQPGHEVVTASLRTQAASDVLAFPVSDFGIIASTVAESAGIQCGAGSPARPLQVWLIDASVQRGASGAPVYASIIRAGQTTRTPVLLGVQAIAWPDRGIAGITPSSVLGELVREALKDPRHQADLYRGVGR